MTEPTVKSNIGVRIREARVEARMTIASLARQLDVDPRTVAGWQAGRSSPSYARLVRLAEVLHKPPSFFLDEIAA
jgi:transcriptional regulator with XRE-family HTH domain